MQKCTLFLLKTIYFCFRISTRQFAISPLHGDYIDTYNIQNEENENLEFEDFETQGQREKREFYYSRRHFLRFILDIKSNYIGM